jgi:O-antigen/teichoic acid export membrane protein
MGLGSGLKTKLSEALAHNDLDKARRLVSTNYVLLTVFSAAIIVVFLIFHHFISWGSVLNAGADDIYIDQLVLFCFISFMVKLVLDSINNILLAHQDTAFVNLIGFVGSFASLGAIFLLSRCNLPYQWRLPALGIIVTFIPTMISLIVSVYFFSTRFKSIIPSIKYFHRPYIRTLFSLGGQFFIIQIAVLIIFSTDSFLVSKLFDTEHVTTYNIAYRLFNAFNIIWGIVLGPYWVAFSEAYLKRDFPWVRKNVTILVYMWLLMLTGLIAILPFVNRIYKLWIGTDVNIPLDLSIGMAIFVAISTFSNIFAYFVNGVAKIRLQVFSSTFAAAINIPVAIYLCRDLKMGLSGVILATCISLSVGAVLMTAQYYRIIKGTATGLWNA